VAGRIPSRASVTRGEDAGADDRVRASVGGGGIGCGRMRRTDRSAPTRSYGIRWYEP